MTRQARPASAEPSFANDEARWDAVRRRDPVADGHFLYSVATTGVYCRPSCAARPARRENVAFHAAPADAERAGFRPCKRCRPDLAPRADREAEMIAVACRAIETAEETPSLDALAAAAGLSPTYFHRTFKRIAGVTPKAYADAQRQRRVQEQLRAGSAVTQTIYEAGFNSSGRFYEAAPKMLGMTPTAYRAGGKGETIRYAVGRCSLGTVLVAATDRGVCTIALDDDAAPLLADLRRRFAKASVEPAGPGFSDWVAEVVRIIDEPSEAGQSSLPLDIRGTAFQRRVWEILRTIPPGETTSYAKVAARLGKPTAVRAVAGACAANPLAVAIPCHRVTAADGRLAGYRWGIERKQRLLERESRRRA
ncbi:MAG TPA: bifunctional DNA-binding transcriptional regulator/O6-methylguanine-DNA methyltransferase Ada [Xanthobacteraceae bacterium]|nr:bifunctional DNA-binding transcriptional regulator/O6-methylguanine-DNA methyltransferase Ada [Xanthobacteraceae bacterium]